MTKKKSVRSKSSKPGVDQKQFYMALAAIVAVVAIVAIIQLLA